MTLCVVWRDSSGEVHFAADSSVTVASNSNANVAIKVTRIPCEIFPPSGDVGSKNAHYQLDIGMAFAGSHVCAYVIKESLVELLTSLQYIPGQTEVSMDKIAKIAFRAYGDLSKRVCSTSIAQNGICEIFLAARCPKNKTVRVFRLSTDPTNNTHHLAEILQGSGVELAGSRTKRAMKSSYYPHEPLKVLKEVIDDPTVDDVGGAIQYGRVEQNKFRIFSVYGYDSDGSPTYMRGGIDINGAINSGETGDLFISTQMIEVT